MKNNKTVQLIIILIGFIPLFYLATIYPGLPERVPTHFDMYGKPNDYSDKSTLILFCLLFFVLSIGSYFLLTNLPKFDPKKTAGQSPELFRKMGILIAIFLTAINFTITWAATNHSDSITQIILPLLGLFFAILGKLMRDIKPNYFAGFRTPWALDNDKNWEATHHLASSIWFWGGLFISLLSLVLPIEYRFICFISIVVILAVIPFVFSYQYFRKHKKDQDI